MVPWRKGLGIPADRDWGFTGWEFIEQPWLAQSV